MKPRHRFRNCIVALSILLMLAVGCGKKHSRVAQTLPAQPQKKTVISVPVGYTEQGIASWYGVPYHGRPAADGEIYDMEKLVAAHRTMPFNTWVRVTNVSNQKSVTVRIIDRGPFVGGRIIDLSKAAAREIELLGPGTGAVRLEVIAAPADVPSTDFYGVQVGAFASFETAERIRAQYAQRFGTAQLASKQGASTIWRVLVGKESTSEAARQIANQLAAENVAGFVVRLDSSRVDANGVGVPAPLPPPPPVPLPSSTTPH